MERRIVVRRKGARRLYSSRGRRGEEGKEQLGIWLRRTGHWTVLVAVENEAGPTDDVYGGQYAS